MSPGRAFRKRKSIFTDRKVNRIDVLNCKRYIFCNKIMFYLSLVSFLARLHSQYVFNISLSCLPRYGLIITTLKIYSLNTNKMHKEKGRCEQRRNATSCFKQILESTPYKTATLGQLTSDFTNHPSQMNKTFWALLKK